VPAGTRRPVTSPGPRSRSSPRCGEYWCRTADVGLVVPRRRLRPGQRDVLGSRSARRRRRAGPVTELSRSGGARAQDNVPDRLARVPRSTYTERNDDVLGGVTTGIYCRPGCRAQAAGRERADVRAAASAEAAGFRACLRCRPYRTAGPLGADAPELAAVRSSEHRRSAGHWNRGGARGEARGLAPHLRRIFHAHLGITPSQLASRGGRLRPAAARRHRHGRADVAFASGFTSLRQFNRQMREVFPAPRPASCEPRRRRADRLVADGAASGCRSSRPSMGRYVAFFASRAVPGVESVSGGCTAGRQPRWCLRAC